MRNHKRTRHNPPLQWKHAIHHGRETPITTREAGREWQKMVQAGNNCSGLSYDTYTRGPKDPIDTKGGENYSRTLSERSQNALSVSANYYTQHLLTAECNTAPADAIVPHTGRKVNSCGHIIISGFLVGRRLQRGGISMFHVQCNVLGGKKSDVIPPLRCLF